MFPARSSKPDSNLQSRARRTRWFDRYEVCVAMLVAAWTAAYVARSRLALAERLSELTNEALLSLLFVVPILLAAWGALFVVDRRFKLGLLGSDDGQ